MKVKEDSEKVGLKLNIHKTKIMASHPITSWQIDGETVEMVRDIFLGSKITAVGDCSHEIKRHLLLGRKTVETQRYFSNKGLSNKSSALSRSHERMWELDHKEGWVMTYWCLWIVMFEKTLESPLVCKEINPVSSKGNQPWIFKEKLSVIKCNPCLK